MAVHLTRDAPIIKFC